MVGTRAISVRLHTDWRDKSGCMRVYSVNMASLGLRLHQLGLLRHQLDLLWVVLGIVVASLGVTVATTGGNICHTWSIDYALTGI